VENINISIIEQKINDYTNLSYKEAVELSYQYVKKEILSQNSTVFEKKRWLILNKKYRKAFLSNKRIHMFKTCTGSGKSVTSVLWAKCMQRLCNKIDGFVVLSTEYENGTDEIERILNRYGFNTNYVRFEGKGKICLERDTKINDNGVKVGDLIDSQISITGYCEEACERYGSCKYYHNCKKIISHVEKGGIKNWIGVQHQIGAILPIYLMHTGETILIIDEDFTDSLKNQFTYGVPQLRQNKMFLDLLFDELKKKKAEEKPLFEFVRQFLILIETFLKDLYTFMTPPSYEKILETIETMDLLKGYDDYLLRQLERKAYEYIRDKKMKPFKFMFCDVCNFIDNYSLECALENKNLENWFRSALIKNQRRFHMSLLYYDKFMFRMMLKNQNIVKILINDATSERDVISFLLPDFEKILEHNENWIYENCKFYQLKKTINNKDPKKQHAMYPKSSFLYKNTFHFLMNDVKSILERHKEQKVLIVAREIEKKEIPFAMMSLSDYISTLGYGNYKFADYPLAGTNEYAEFDVCIILGKPELPQAVLKRQSSLINMEQEKYRDMYSKNMITQGMGRIFRGSKKKYVYLLTGFDVGIKSDIKTFKSHTEFQDSMKKIVKNREEKIEKNGWKKKVIFYLEKNNNEIDVKNCEKILGVSYYKSSNFLNFLNTNGVLKVKIEERGKKIYFI